jgi:hypothetical protein
MGHRIELPAYAAIPAVLAILGGAYLAKPEEFRRDPLLEAQGLIGLAPKYEAMYAGCTDGTDKASLDLKSFAKGFAGGYAHRFPATGDADAVQFARDARPQCRLSSLYRLYRRWPVRSNSPTRYRRTPVDI